MNVKAMEFVIFGTLLGIISAIIIYFTILTILNNEIVDLFSIIAILIGIFVFVSMTIVFFREAYIEIKHGGRRNIEFLSPIEEE